MADVATIVFLAWFLVSVAGQVPGKTGFWVRRFDVIGLIPSWSFFAPNPVRTDTHLMYRHVLASEEVTDWTEAFVWHPRRLRLIWNPDRRAEKAISDASGQILGRSDTRGMTWSVPYLLLLNYVDGLPRPHATKSVQFALMTSFGSETDMEPVVRFASNTHPIGELAAA